jgi:hypothetical protein
LNDPFWLFGLVMLTWLALLSACVPIFKATPLPSEIASPMPTLTPRTPSPTLAFLSTPTPLPTPRDDLPSVEAARLKLAQQLGVDAGALILREVTDQEWNDACLGLAQPGEMCAQVIVPGYLVVFEVDGRSYDIRTDINGTIVRLP